MPDVVTTALVTFAAAVTGLLAGLTFKREGQDALAVPGFALGFAGLAATLLFLQTPAGAPIP